MPFFSLFPHLWDDHLIWRRYWRASRNRHQMVPSFLSPLSLPETHLYLHPPSISLLPLRCLRSILIFHSDYTNYRSLHPLVHSFGPPSPIPSSLPPMISFTLCPLQVWSVKHAQLARLRVKRRRRRNTNNSSPFLEKTSLSWGSSTLQ